MAGTGGYTGPLEQVGPCLWKIPKSYRADMRVDGLIFAAGSRAIDGVWRRGRQVVAQGRHVDRDRIAARYRAVLAELLA